jgi:hypothetical protein
MGIGTEQNRVFGLASARKTKDKVVKITGGNSVLTDQKL